MIYAFGAYRLDTDRQEIWRGQEPVTVEPQVFGVLRCLIENQDRVVSKEELIESVWEGRFIADATLSARISAARRAVGDNGKDQAVIRTVSKRGFRFTGDVRLQTECEVDEVSPTLSNPVTSKVFLRPNKPSLAVMPFSNLSSDRGNEYFTDGLTEDIITALTYVPWIFVIARNSTFTYKDRAVDVRQIGRELGVRYILEGSVRQHQERLRVTGQLIDAETGAHIWADRFDGMVVDVFDFQDKLTEAVVAAIAPSIRDAEMDRAFRTQTRNLDAYHNYLRALTALSRAQTNLAAKHLENAIADAPNYAKAMAMRAWCYTTRLSWSTGISDEGERQLGIDLALLALDLDHGDLEVAAFAGYTLSFYGADIDRGLALVREATERCPSFAWAWTSRSMLEAIHGDPNQAIDFGRTAQRLSPMDPMMFRTHIALSAAFDTMGKHESALEHAKLGLQLNPNLVILETIKVGNLVKLGHVKEAQEEAKKFFAKNGTFRVQRFIEHLKRFRSMGKIVESRREGLLLSGLPE